VNDEWMGRGGGGRWRWGWRGSEGLPLISTSAIIPTLIFRFNVSLLRKEKRMRKGGRKELKT